MSCHYLLIVHSKQVRLCPRQRSHVHKNTADIMTRKASSALVHSRSKRTYQASQRSGPVRDSESRLFQLQPLRWKLAQAARLHVAASQAQKC